MPSCNVENLMGAIFKDLKAAGANITDDTVKGVNPEGQAIFAKGDNDAHQAMVTDTIDEGLNGDPDVAAHENLKELGAPENILTNLRDPAVLLGEDFVRPLERVLQAHGEEFGFRFDNKSRDRYDETVLPVIDQLANVAEDALPRHKFSFLNDYLNFYRRGGEFYGGKPPTGFGILASNAIRNLVMFNPIITGLNVFEFLPKSIANYGVDNTLRGMTRYLTEVNGQFWKRIPELEARGVYAKRIREEGLISKLDLLNLTENPLRGASYYVGEAAGVNPLEALQKVAFVYRPGRVPRMLWSVEGAQSVALMRYFIEATKMYSQWMKNVFDGVRTGNAQLAGEGAKALALFSFMQAVQTGAQSAIPEPLWNLLPEDFKDGILEFDENAPINLLKKTTGVDLAERTQPLPSLGLGVGFQIAQRQADLAARQFTNTAVALSEEEFTAAGVEFAKGVMKLGALGPAKVGAVRIPGINFTASKLGDIVTDVLTEETAPEEIPEALLDKFNLDLAQ